MTRAVWYSPSSDEWRVQSDDPIADASWMMSHPDAIRVEGWKPLPLEARAAVPGVH